MGDCKYCGKPAGILRSKHTECENRFDYGINKISSLVKSSFSNDSSLIDLKEEAKKIASRSHISEIELNNTLHKGWQAAIERAFDDGLLSEKEEKRLGEMIEIFGFNRDSLNSDPSYVKMVRGAVLRDVMEGHIPERMTIIGNVPFNLQKSEKLVWVFSNVKYYEMRTRRQYVGGYQGFSVRIAKGLYYRAGAFKGHPVETTQMVHVDTGFLGVTTNHIYFSGQSKGFRIKYDKIVSFEPYSDGLGVQKDGQTAKPQVFVTGDGWFTANLIMNLAKL